MKTRKKKILIFLTALTCLILSSGWVRYRFAKRFEYVEAEPDTLRVVTWNVGYFAPVSDKNLRDVDVEPVASLLSGLSADVVILQELGNTEQAADIAKLLGAEWNVQVAETGHGNQVMAVLSPREYLSMDSFECGGRTTLGVSLAARNHASVYVVGVHAPHPARGVEENTENIRCALARAAARTEEIRVVTGDLNFNFDPGSNGEFYTEIMQTYGDGTLALGETYYARTRIDHMFHFPKDLPVIPEASGMVDLPLRFAKVPGFRDHRPVVVTYNLE